jgi:tetratricopeptide (TPR) repeat protein
MRRLQTILTAAVLIAAAAAVSQAGAAGIQNPAEDMKLQSADPSGQTKAPKVRKRPASERKTKAPETKAPEIKAPDKKSEQPFIDGYRHAYDLIYRQQNYAEAIAALRSLRRDTHPDVANLIGFASRKLGRTEDAKVWYEAALAADPKHTRTWQYYGMWHLERGDRARAEEHLATIEAICGTGCDDYTSLKLALAGDGLVY